jgi:hypothetical protein
MAAVAVEIGVSGEHCGQLALDLPGGLPSI